jgi:DNA-directed RNA polymerase specialized sigma subunit
MAGLTTKTIQTWGREAQDLEISDERAVEIEKVIEATARVARAAAPSLSFDAEPADFLRALHRWADKTT